MRFGKLDSVTVQLATQSPDPLQGFLCAWISKMWNFPTHDSARGAGVLSSTVESDRIFDSRFQKPNQEEQKNVQADFCRS